MIVDTHIHYVEPPTADRPHDAHGSPATHKLVEELIAEATAIGIDKILQVSPTAMGWDNRYGLEGVQRHSDRVAGVFGRFDPTQNDLEQKLVAFVAQPGMLGIRVQPRAGQASEFWLRDKTIDPFFAVAEKHNFAIGCYAPDQASWLQALAKRFPKLRIIVEHMALQNRTGGDQAWDHWNDVLALAAEPNVWMKVSFFPEAANRADKYPFVRSQEKFKQLYDKVGPGRMVWGSNYPPCKVACTYQQALDFVRVECKFLSAADKAGILGDNFMSEFGAKKTPR